MREIKITFIKENIEDFLVEEIKESFDDSSPEFIEEVFDWIKEVYRYDYEISSTASDKLDSELDLKSNISYDELNLLFKSLDGEFCGSQEAEYYYRRGFKIS